MVRAVAPLLGRAFLGYDRRMSGLEQADAVERVPERCEECGAQLTANEIRVAHESSGPALCAVHAAERLPELADPEGDEPTTP
jgi:hypothetical protein